LRIVTSIFAAAIFTKAPWLATHLASTSSPCALVRNRWSSAWLCVFAFAIGLSFNGIVHAQSQNNSANTSGSALPDSVIVAATDSDGDDAILDQIDVIGEEIPSTGDVIHGEFTGQHQRIERAALERRDRSIGDIVAFESGVQRRQVGGLGTYSSVTVRAASAAQTPVYLDGIRLNSAGINVIDLSTLELLSVQHIDIYRGSTPLQLGQGAIGGGINLSTLQRRQRQKTPDNKLLIGLGSFGVQRTEATHRSSHGAWDTTGAISLQQADNDFAFLDDNGTALNALDDTRQQRNNADVEQLGMLGKLGFQWSANSRTDLLLQTGARQLGVPEIRNRADNEAAYHTDTLQVQLSQTHDQWGNWNTRHSLFHHQQIDNFVDPLGQVRLSAQDTTTRARSIGFKSYWERPANANTLGLTLEWRRETLTASDQRQRVANFEALRLDSSVTAQWTWFDAEDRWTITPALQASSSRDSKCRMVSQRRALPT